MTPEERAELTGVIRDALAAEAARAEPAIKVRDLVVRRANRSVVYRVESIAVNPEGGERVVICSRPNGGDGEERPESEWELYPEDHPTAWAIRTIVGGVGFVVGVASCLVALYSRMHASAEAAASSSATITYSGFDAFALYANAVIWTFGPPIWFILEYTALAKRYGNPRNKADLQYGQGLASKFWLGVGALLVIIYKGTM